MHEVAQNNVVMQVFLYYFLLSFVTDFIFFYALKYLFSDPTEFTVIKS
jgi:hypothetical protein